MGPSPRHLHDASAQISWNYCCQWRINFALSLWNQSSWLQGRISRTSYVDYHHRWPMDIPVSRWVWIGRDSFSSTPYFDPAKHMGHPQTRQFLSHNLASFINLTGCLLSTIDIQRLWTHIMRLYLCIFIISNEYFLFLHKILRSCQ